MKRKSILKKVKKCIPSRVILTGLTFAAVGLGGRYLYNVMEKSLVPEKIVFAYDHIYSDSAKKKVDTFAKDYLVAFGGVENFDIETFSKEVRDRFAFVKKVFWDWKTIDQAVVTIEGVKPLFCVNDEEVIGNKRRLFPYSLFSNATADKLYVLDLELEDNVIPHSIYMFLKNIPQSYLQNYNIGYANKNSVSLNKKDKESMTLLVDENFFNGSQKLDVAHFVHSDFSKRVQERNCARRWLRRRGNNRLVYDMRFKDRIYAKVKKNESKKKSVRGNVSRKLSQGG